MQRYNCLCEASRVYKRGHETCPTLLYSLRLGKAERAKNLIEEERIPKLRPKALFTNVDVFLIISSLLEWALIYDIFVSLYFNGSSNTVEWKRRRRY